MPQGPKIPDPGDFWDLSDLVPPKKQPKMQAPRRSIEAVEVTAPPAGGNDTVTDGKNATDVPLREHFISPHTPADLQPPPAPADSYVPEGSLIRAVRIYPWKTEYHYYEQFCRYARALADKEGKEAPQVDFFSYMPQYSQMNRGQFAYYLWWRTNFRRGVCLDAAYSYLLLYLYELINQGDTITPKTGQENMLRLWLSYRDRHPHLDVLVREWLLDYSLLYHLPPPLLPRTLFRDLVSGCRLREFYVSAAEHADYYCEAVLLFCSNYDYKKSKFYGEDTAPLYDKILPGAAGAALAYLQEKKGENSPRYGGYSTISRDAFSGAVCSYRLKRRIEVDYASFSHTHELRYIITDVLKYAENALRGALGIKSRLSVFEIDGALRAVLDAYLKDALPARPAKKAVAVEQTPDYEKHYELPAVPVSPERAAKIEAMSWQTTQKLVEAFEENVILFEKPIAENPAPSPTQMQNIAICTIGGAADAKQQQNAEKRVPSPTQMQNIPPEDAFVAAIGDLADFLPLAAAGDRQGQRAFAMEKGRMPDAIADRINTLAEEHLGDILLEDAGGFYTVIADYVELLEERELL